MATTTNYTWETPDDTDLVKDGAAAIRTLGSAIDSTVFTNASAAINKTIVDAKGDLIAATAADTVSRLAVGANNSVLQADSSTATGLKWATLPASGFTLISRQTFTNVANTGTTFDNIFSTTYQSYMVVFENLTCATTANTLQMQLRYAGPTTETATYYGAALQLPAGSGLPTVNNGYGGSAEANISGNSNASTKPNTGQLFINGVGNSSERASWNGAMISPNNPQMSLLIGTTDTERTYLGLIFKSSASNISGTIAVYGLAV